MLHSFYIHFCICNNTLPYRMLLGMYAGNYKIHFAKHHVLQSFRRINLLTDCGYTYHDIMSIEITIHIYYISFTAAKKCNSMPGSGPVIAAQKILIVFKALIIRKKHVTEMIGTCQKLNSIFRSCSDIFLYSRIGMS